VIELRSLDPKLREEIARLIRDASAAAKQQEEAEKASGKKLFDSPKASLLAWPTRTSLVSDERRSEDIFLLAGGRFLRHSLQIGETSYLIARRAWKAYTPVLDLIEKETALTRLAAIMMAPQIFPYMYGVVTVLRRYEKGRPYILVGVRSQKLAGMNGGMASFPGGLVDPNEPLKLSGPRELFEEGMRGHIRAFTGFAFDVHPDCPSISFSMLAETDSRDILPSYEWEGRRMIWVDETAVRNALHDPNENRDLRETFTAHDINITEDIRFAPDVSAQVLNLLRMYDI
jgi:8-oxo-dGTP pyrophosphatase MutT (NUDIX family)